MQGWWNFQIRTRLLPYQVLLIMPRFSLKSIVFNLFSIKMLKLNIKTPLPPNHTALLGERFPSFSWLQTLTTQWFWRSITHLSSDDILKVNCPYPHTCLESGTCGCGSSGMGAFIELRFRLSQGLGQVDLPDLPLFCPKPPSDQKNHKKPPHLSITIILSHLSENETVDRLYSAFSPLYL